MDLDYIIIIAGSILVAGVVGVGGGFLAHKFRDWVLARRALKFLQGKGKNTIRVDGETINIDKFKWKDQDGVMQKTEIKPFEAPKPSSY